jgi:hypothetical protein
MVFMLWLNVQIICLITLCHNVVGTGCWRFRQKSYQFQSIENAQEAVLFAASKGYIPKIQEMVIINPERRASAVQMLVKCFNGEGLSPWNKVPALISPWLAIALAKEACDPRQAQLR